MRIRQNRKRTKTFMSLLPVLIGCLMLFAAVPVSAQHAAPAEKQVSGKIVDTDGAPMVGVTVTIKSKPQKGSASNADGDFLISAAPGDILVFSFIGFNTKEIPVKELDGHQTVVLEPDTQSLEEVVVVGYGVQKKVSVVGAVNTVNMKEFKSVPAPSISQALVGKIPGLVSRQVSGEPGQDQAYLYILQSDNLYLIS